MSEGGITCEKTTFHTCATKGGYGGAVWVKGPTNFTDCPFENCNASDAVAIWYDQGDKLILQGFAIRECYGGGNTVSCVRIDAPTDMIFRKLTVNVSTSSKPLVLFAGGTSFEIVDCHFDGGDGTIFRDNAQCIAFPDQTDIVIKQSSFANLIKDTNGGAAFRFSGSGRVCFENCIFRSLTVRDGDFNGGALSFPPDGTHSISLTDCLFEQCTASQNGGAVYIGGSSNCLIEKCSFIGNSGDNAGQSLHIAYVSMQTVVRNCTFSGHTKGAIAVVDFKESGSCTLESWVFVDNVLGAASTSSIQITGAPDTIVYEECRFTSNTYGGESSVTVDQSRVSNFTKCEFVGCSADGVSLVRFQSSDGEKSVVFQECQFSKCQTQTAPVLTLEVQHVTLISCDISECESVSGTVSVASILCNGLTFRDNTIEFSSPKSSGHSVISIGALNNNIVLDGCKFLCIGSEKSFGRFVTLVASGDSGEAISFEILGCTVSGNGNTFLDGWLVHPAKYQKIDVHRSEFSNIVRGGSGGGAFRFAGDLGGISGEVDFQECTFRSVSTTNNGGAVSLTNANLDHTVISGCTFDGCSCGSSSRGGALHIDVKGNTGRCTVQNCTFINNHCSGGAAGLSICVYGALNFLDSGSSIENCTFQDHEGSNIIYVVRQSSGDVKLDREYNITDCRFISNTVTASSGLVYVFSDYICYDNCKFISNTVGAGHSDCGLVCAGNSQQCRFIDCTFEKCDASSGLSLISVIPPVGELSFSHCDFLDCLGAVLDASSAQRAATPSMSALIVQDSTFSRCSTVSIPLLKFSTASLVLIGSSFSQLTSSVSPLACEVTTSGSITNAQFYSSGGGAPLIDLRLENSTSMDFYNCCFVHSGEAQPGVPLFFAIQGDGSVVFTASCFDSDKESSISSDGRVEYVDTDFGECFCGIPPPPSEVPSSSEAESTPFESSTPIEPTRTSGEESGSGAKNAGIIAGVVVVVLVIIIVIVVLLIILLRRKKTEVTEEEHGGDEFTEETVSTLTEEQSHDNAEWTQTQDNPLFASANYGEEDAFESAFEETGFLTGDP